MANVVADNSLLTHWKLPRPRSSWKWFVSKNYWRQIYSFIYWILRIGLMGASENFKNQNFKNQLFSSSQKKIISNWNLGLILMLLLFLLIRLRIYVCFQRKNLNKWALNHNVRYTNHLSHWNTTKISLCVS